VPAPPGAEDAVLDVRAPGHRVTGVVLDVGAGADEVADRGVDPLLADLAPLDAVGLAVARLAGHRAVLARGGDRGRPVLGADGDRRVLVLVTVRYLRRLLPGDRVDLDAHAGGHAVLGARHAGVQAVAPDAGAGGRAAYDLALVVDVVGGAVADAQVAAGVRAAAGLVLHASLVLVLAVAPGPAPVADLGLPLSGGGRRVGFGGSLVLLAGARPRLARRVLPFGRIRTRLEEVGEVAEAERMRLRGAFRLLRPFHRLGGANEGRDQVRHRELVRAVGVVRRVREVLGAAHGARQRVPRIDVRTIGDRVVLGLAMHRRQPRKERHLKFRHGLR